MSKLLVITRHAPYGSSGAREALELALAGALFDQEVSLLLMDDGVFQLLPGQTPKAIDQKNLGAMLQSLPMYDIEKIYVSESALKARGLDISAAAVPVEVLDSQAIQALISSQDQVFNV